MGDELETLFRKRLMNEVHMEYDSIEKINEIRKNYFNVIKENFSRNFTNFSKIDNILIKECTPFDRKTELRKEKYDVELFIDFYEPVFIIENRIE